MEPDRGNLGWLISGAGALVLICALWAPWYHVNTAVTAPLFRELGQQAGQFGVLAPYIQQGAAALAAETSFDLTAWDAFGQLDVTLLVLGVAMLGLAILSFTGRAQGVGAVVAVLGAIACALTLYRMLHRPLPNEILGLARGAYLALAGGVAAMLGGVLDARTDSATSSSPVPWQPVDPHPASWPSGDKASPPGA